MYKKTLIGSLLDFLTGNLAQIHFSFTILIILFLGLAVFLRKRKILFLMFLALGAISILISYFTGDIFWELLD